jgi:hypothetical protein
MTAPMAAPSRLRIGVAVSWIASSSPRTVHQHDVIRGNRRLAVDEHAIERIRDGSTRRFVDELQHFADRPAARLVDGPAREPLGNGIQIVDVRAWRRA